MKTIIKKSTGDYAIYNSGEFYTSSCPQIISQEATMEALKVYAKNFDNIDLDMTDYEIIEVDIIRKNKPIVKESRCCGRCNGIDDICVGDTTCEPHNILGCEICFGER